MDVMGEALAIDRSTMLALASEAEISPAAAEQLIERICGVASQFAALSEKHYPRMISSETLRTVQGRIDENIALLL